MPKFGDLGKTVKDLLDDDFDAGKNQIEYKFKTAGGVDAKFKGSKGCCGKVKFSNETKFSTKGIDFKEKFDNSGSITLEATTKKLGKGTKIVGEVVTSSAFGLKDSTFKGEYSGINNLFVTAKYNTTKKATTFDAVYTYDAFNVGVQGKMAGSGTPALDYAVAYNKDDMTTTTKLTGGKNINVSVAYKASAALDTGLSVDYDTAGSAASATLAGAYAYDGNTSTKFKLGSDQSLGLAFTHKLRNEITLGLSTSVDLKESKADAVGISLKFSA
jgi:hypothetical protein